MNAVRFLLPTFRARMHRPFVLRCARGMHLLSRQSKIKTSTDDKIICQDYSFIDNIICGRLLSVGFL